MHPLAHFGGIANGGNAQDEQRGISPLDLYKLMTEKDILGKDLVIQHLKGLPPNNRTRSGASGNVTAKELGEEETKEAKEDAAVQRNGYHAEEEAETEPLGTSL